jgi:hypothetical protein
MNALVEKIEGRIDRNVTSNVALHKIGGGFAVVPTTVEQALELAKVMSTARGMLPEHLLGNPGACADVVFQALSWGVNPFALAKQSYIAQRGGSPSYMSQAISAAVNGNPALKGRLSLSYAGEGDNMTCTVTGTFVDDPENPQSYTSPRIKDITPKNSPLWKSDAPRQLGYWSQRAWARLFAADILMGVYDADELTPEMLAKPVAQIDPFAGEGPRLPSKGGDSLQTVAIAATYPDAGSSLPAPVNSEAVEPLAPASVPYSSSDSPPLSEPEQSGVAGAASAHNAAPAIKSPEDAARWAGETARASGVPEDANPYDENSPLWLAWLEGYHNG